MLEPWLQVKVEVTGAGAGDANGTYTFTGELHNDRPLFKNSAGLFLNWNRDNLPGWGIRKEKDDFTQYRTDRDGDLPPDGGWQQFGHTALQPAPTVKIVTRPIVQMDRQTGLKRNLDHVVAVQEQSWKHRKFSDAEIVCAGVRVAAHRGTLSAASRVFDAAFSSTMSEGQTAIYEIKEATPAAVEAMLHHIYTGVLQCQSDDLPSLFTLAMRYELDALGTDVATHMLEDVNAENVKSRLTTLKLHCENHVAQSAMTKIVNMIQASKDAELILALV